MDRWKLEAIDTSQRAANSCKYHAPRTRVHILFQGMTYAWRVGERISPYPGGRRGAKGSGVKVAGTIERGGWRADGYRLREKQRRDEIIVFFFPSFVETREISLLSMGFTASRWKSSPQA